MMQSQSLDNFLVGELTVNTNRLDDILRGISCSLEEHKRALTKLHELDDQQTLIRKELHLLKLTQTSQDIHNAKDISNQRYLDEEQKNGNQQESGHEESKIEYPTERRSAGKMQKVHQDIHILSADMEAATLRDLRRDIVGMKSSIIQLQNDLNIELADSSELSTQVDYLRTNLFALEKEIGSSSHSATILDIKRAISDNYNNLVKSIQAIEHRVRKELDCEMRNKASEIKATFNSLESLHKRRLSHFESRLVTFAKESDLVALANNVDNESNDTRKRLDVVEKNVVYNEQALLNVKHRAALATLRKCNWIWKRKMIKIALSKWKVYVQCAVETEQRSIHRKKKIRHLLIRHWFGRKQKAWKKWLLFIQYHRRVESLKDQAVKRICSRMNNSLQAPLYHAFNRLRRITISDKIKRARMQENEKDTNYDDLNDIHSNHFDLSAIINSFQNDKDGAIHTLAQEVNNIRVHDIKKVCRDFKNSDIMIQENFDRSISEEVLKIVNNISSLEQKLDQNLELLSSQLPPMKSHISELRSSLHGTVNRVKIIEQTHRDRIELLCESKEMSDEKIVELESDLKHAIVKLRSLEYNNERSQNLVNTLLQKMNDFEKMQREATESFVIRIDKLQNDLVSMNSEVTSGLQDRKAIHNSLVEVKNDIKQAKIASKSSVDSVYKILDSYGIRKPKLQIVIDDGVLYEKLAKEKNYVMQLNSVINNGTHDIDMTSHIASFAHDYAAWIAYLADQEALQLVVTGKNPESAIFAEDDMETKRRDLVHSFKDELGKALNLANPDAGAIRLEARARYVGRVVDAVDAALSKHDQVFIPASTRLGRVKASVPTCVACDRPLTTKGRRSSDIEKSEGETKPLSRSKQTSASFFNNEVKPFVMRGGFKMPSNN